MKDRFSLNSFYLNGADGKQYYYTHLQVRGGGIAVALDAMYVDTEHLQGSEFHPGRWQAVLLQTPAGRGQPVRHSVIGDELAMHVVLS
jgi:hypothetical protein